MDISMTEANKPSIKTNQFTGAGISFKYPEGGQVVEIKHADGSVVVRLLGLILEKPLNIDLEILPNVSNAKEEIERLAAVDRTTFPNEIVAPYSLKAGQLDGWRFIYRATDGGHDSGYMDIVLVNTPNGVYRISMNPSVDQYNQGRMVFDIVLNDFALL
jgi:hypothetical protein